jgi:deoxyribose-phosphate aldolase
MNQPGQNGSGVHWFYSGAGIYNHRTQAVLKNEEIVTDSIKSIAKLIDHSLLHPKLSDKELQAGCLLARQYDVASVCIKPYAVPLAREILAKSQVHVGTVIGFPHGANHLEIKVKETERALADGAEELDMVINIGKVLSADWTYVAEEIRTINNILVEKNGILKVIFENDFLTDKNYKLKLCEICSQQAVAFVKTSTGYGFVKQKDGNYNYRGATDADLVLMRQACAKSVQLKAAGGIRSLDDVLRVKALGVTRVGTTSTENILKEAQERGYL